MEALLSGPPFFISTQQRVGREKYSLDKPYSNSVINENEDNGKPKSGD